MEAARNEILRTRGPPFRTRRRTWLGLSLVREGPQRNAQLVDEGLNKFMRGGSYNKILSVSVPSPMQLAALGGFPETLEIT